MKTVEQSRQLAKQLGLVKNLENIQKLKLDEERKKLNQGRSTTFQVLSFEQDYNNARAQRLSVELGAQQFISNLRMFIQE
jgi:outer membrane protein TolC